MCRMHSHGCGERHLDGSDNDLAGRDALLLAAADAAHEVRPHDGVGAHLRAEHAFGVPLGGRGQRLAGDVTGSRLHVTR